MMSQDASDRMTDRFDVAVIGGGVAGLSAALVVAPRFVARSGVLTGLGLHASPHQLGPGEHIAASTTGLTEVPGIWVAGNVTDLMAQVVTAASGGAVVGAAVNADLVTEDTRRAVVAYRDRPTAATERQTASAS